MDRGETVQECCVREVKEETGLDVEIERLVGLYARLRPRSTHMDWMSFLFVCRVVGGRPRVTEETTDIRYWPVDDLPSNIPRWHRRYLADAQNGSPQALWRTMPASWWVPFFAWPALRWRELRNRLWGRPKFVPHRWGLGVFVTLFDDDGRVLLVRRRDVPVWNLPGGRVEPDETPWQAGLREVREETGLEIELERLTGVYSKPARDQVVLNFMGRVVGGRLTPTEEAAESGYFSLDALPEPILPKHVERIHHSTTRQPEVVFQVQDTPPGLEVLGFKR
jgi:ADP-ribose pyrophosphatase YjhB (NUDIX family)